MVNIFFQSHNNEMVCDVKRRIAETLKQPVDQLNIACDDVTLGNSKDRCLVGFVGLQDDDQTWVVKSQGMATSTSTSTSLVVYDEGAKDSAQTSAASVARQAALNEQVGQVDSCS